MSALIGTSRPLSELRAAVWSAIFTRDLGEHLRTCDTWRADAATLVTGPSGTGKEQVAQALGGSRFVAFDGERVRFALGEGHAVSAVNLAAVSGLLFESELFGHVKGSFTGAVSDRKGVFEGATTRRVRKRLRTCCPDKHASSAAQESLRARARRAGPTARIVSVTRRVTTQVTSRFRTTFCSA